MNIILTTFNRYDYLKPSLESLYRSEFAEADVIWIYDDNSDKEVKELLLTYENSTAPKTELHFNNENLGCDLNVYRSIKKTLEKTNEDFIVVTDSDALYNSGWLSFIKKELAWHGNKVGMLSAFNTDGHPTKHEFSKTLVKKGGVGGLAVALNRKVFDLIDPTLVLPGHSCFCWDWQFIELCNNMNYDILCSKDSYVEHIGKFGVHSMGRTDLAQNFLGANLAYEEKESSLSDYIMIGYENL